MPFIQIIVKPHKCGRCGQGHSNWFTHRCRVPFSELGAAAVDRKRRAKQAAKKSR